MTFYKLWLFMTENEGPALKLPDKYGKLCRNLIPSLLVDQLAEVTFAGGYFTKGSFSPDDYFTVPADCLIPA